MKIFKILITAFVMVGFLGLTTGASVAAFDLFPTKTCIDAEKTAGGEEPTVCEDGKSGQTTANNSLYGANGVITKVANLLAMLVGIAAVVVIIISGIQYMLSKGDPAKITNAKNTILYAIVGLIVVLLARTIVVFVVTRL